MQENRRKSAALVTIGYEGTKIDDFVATLQQVEIEILVDIRDIPVSRKPGFSKKILANTLHKVGIKYVHLRELGDPKSGRKAAQQGHIKKFERIFRNHLERAESQKALDQAVDIATENRAVLLCFENDHSNCHRRLVAEAMAERGQFSIYHIAVVSGQSTDANQNQNVVESAYAFG